MHSQMPTTVGPTIEPLSLILELEKCWRQRCGVNPQTWGVLVLKLVSLLRGILAAAATSLTQGNIPVQISPEQFWETLNACEELQDSLKLLQQKYVRPGQDEPRSADGIMQADQGVFRLFQGCTKTTLAASLEGIDLVNEAGELGMQFWMCKCCRRPTSEEYAEHMSKKHPEARPEGTVEPLRVSDMLRLVQTAKNPATALYSAESPIFRASNQAMRQWREDSTAFHKWRAFAYLLDCELRELPRLEGIVYRAVPRRLPASLYRKGNVVTWNQPSSTSEDPRVARHFLTSRSRVRPTGAIFIIHSVTGRPIKEHSLYKEEKEVLFPAGTQFQVVNQADVGLKTLLEAAMRCNLQEVDVYEVRELVLDSWCDVETYVDATRSTQNPELFDLIRQQPTQPVALRNVVKRCCGPMSSLLRREDGATALHLAAAVPNNLPCVQVVCSALQDGDDLARDGDGRTALCVAVDMGHEDSALFLLQRFRGWTQLSQAQCRKALPWVCAAGDHGLSRALCEAAHSAEAMQQGLLAACSQSQLQCIETLVECHADVRHTHADGWTALMTAAQRGQAACVRAMVGHQADVAAAWRDGSTALMFAAEQGYASCIEALIDGRADVGGAKHNGSTALHLAAHFGRTACVRALIERNADVAAAKSNGWTAVMYAAQSGHRSCVRALAVHKADVGVAAQNGATPLIVAAKNSHVDCIDALVECRADVGASAADGRTPLHFAAIGGHAACVRALIDRHRAPVGVADDTGQTALMDAAQNGDVECVRVLLQRRADPGAVHATGQTALMWAALGGHSACVAALVQHRADVRATNYGGWTALMAARCSGAAACVEALEAHGADADAAGGGAGAQSPQRLGAGEGAGLAAGCPHCGARVGVVARAVYAASTFVCDCCQRSYATCGGLYHCSCGMDTCRTCMGVGGLGARRGGALQQQTLS